MEDRTSGRVVAREPCPDCGSRDNLARYEDGSAFCFGMDCGRYEPPADGAVQPRSERRRPLAADLIEGEYRALPKRSIRVETCQKMGYQIGATSSGALVHLANHVINGQIAAQKVRTADKTFFTTGAADALRLWPMHVWPDTGKRVVVTEGEIDALSVAQEFGLSWPVVSVPKGAAGAEAAIRRDLKWLEGYETVVLWFDNDEAGRSAAAACARLFTPGRCSLAFAPDGFKDASDMLQAGKVKELLRCVYDAKPYRPEGVRSLADIRDRILAPVEMGAPWPWPSVTKETFGRRAGEVYGFGAATGAGKTDLFTQIIAHDVMLGETCGVLYLEQPVGETGKRIAGKIAGKRFHVPDGSWTQDELVATLDKLEAAGKLHFFEAFGANSWEVIGPILRFMTQGLGCTRIFLDHLTALAAEEEDENAALKVVMAKLAGLGQETGAMIHYISHLTTPEGKPHEEGGRVMVRHFRGSRTIGFWSHFMFGLERDQQADDEDERATTTLRCLKDRNTGNATGKTWALRYDRATGNLSEMPPAPEKPANPDF